MCLIHLIIHVPAEQFILWLFLCWPLRLHKTPFHTLPLHSALYFCGETLLNSFILLILLIFSSNALSCSCYSEAMSYEEEFKSYDAIFLATATDVERGPSDWNSGFYKTEMKVDRVYRNKGVPRTVFIKTALEINSCGGPAPTTQSQYLVFAHKTNDGLYETGGCSKFMNIDQVNSDLKSANAEEKAEWQSMLADMWSALGNPIIVYEK